MRSRCLALFLSSMIASPALPNSTYPTEIELLLPGGSPVIVPATGAQITLVQVTDQRCPAGVECYWEGMSRVELSVAVPDQPAETVVLCNMCDDAQSTVVVAGMTLGRIRLEPSQEELAVLGHAPALFDYSARILVSLTPP